MTSPEWKGDWQQRINARARELGFGNLEVFADSYPAKTFAELSKMLGQDVAPIQIEDLCREDALAAGRFDAFARSSLARRIRQQLSEGWRVGANVEWRQARAFSAWGAGLGGECEAEVRRTWEQARQLAEIPDDWLPEGPDDEWLKRMLDGIFFR